MSDKKYTVIELGNEGQHQEQEVDYETIKDRAIQLVPSPLYPIVLPLLKAIAAWQQMGDERWWMISFADRVGPVGNFVAFTTSPYQALIVAIRGGHYPPNGFVEVAAWMGPKTTEGQPNNAQLLYRLLTPEEAEEFDFVWKT